MYMFYFTEIFGLVHLFCHESVKEAYNENMTDIYKIMGNVVMRYMWYNMTKCDVTLLHEV